MAEVKKKRRLNGEGSIRQRKDKSWEARYSDPFTNKQKSVYGKTKAECRKKLSEKMRELDLKSFILPTDMTLTEFFDWYCDNYKINTVKPQTLYTNRLRFKNVFKDTLGDVKLIKINEQMIQSVLDARIAEGMSQSYLKACYTCLNELFKFAIKRKMLLQNPMQYVEYFRRGKESEEKEEISDEQLYWFFRGLKERDGRYLFFFEFLLNTGMRVSEICGLKWEDVSEDFRFIKVKNNVVRYKDETGKFIKSLSTPKTNSSKRWIPVRDSMQPKFKEYYEMYLKTCEYMDLEFSPENFVFVYDWKRIEIPLERGYVANVMRTTFNYIENTYGCKVKPFTCHCFRHKFISVAVGAKMPLRDLMNITGHSEVRTLMGYAHTQKEKSMQRINEIPEMFNQRGEEEHL